MDRAAQVDSALGWAMVVAGGVLIATGVGGPVGLMLVSAGADTIIQKATTGEVNWGQVAVAGAAGAVGFGVGGAVARTAGTGLRGTIAVGAAGGVPLSPAAVADRVAEYQGAAAAGQPGLQLRGDVEGGVVAVVVATRTVDLPFSGLLGRAPLEVEAVARARAPLADP